MNRELLSIAKIKKRKIALSKHQTETIIVTGASSGIGREVALQFAVEGAQLILIARRKQLLEEVATEVEQLGGKALAIPIDVSNREQVESAVRLIDERYGKIDVLVNNAGYGVYGTVESCLPEDFEGQIKVNYLGAVYLTKAVLPIMRRQKTGAIINISSICGKVVTPLDSGYCASKFALNAFTTILRKEMEGSGVSVSLVCPGFTETNWESAVVQRHGRSLRRILPSMSSERVARAIVSCVNKPKAELIIPNMLRLQVLGQFVSPRFYEWFYFKFRGPRQSATENNQGEPND